MVKHKVSFVPLNYIADIINAFHTVRYSTSHSIIKLKFQKKMKIAQVRICIEEQVVVLKAVNAL